ncbi:MAG: hypothetical protein NE327_02355 [Lentisphaeraceae bacterium]|nr:hypothetical protein [Lentisphaeraceae bacterium]
MQARTIDAVDKEIAEIDRQINERKEAMRTKKRERRSLLRQERDQLRYVAGGLIFDYLSDFEAKYPGIVKELYQRADTRDKIKFVRAGLVKDNLVKLVDTNKSECQESVKNLKGEVSLESLNEEDKKKLQTIMTAVNDPAKNLKRKIYCKADEIKVYTGPNQELYISNELAAYLRDSEGFAV